MSYLEKHPMIMIVTGILGISLSAIFVRYSQGSFYRNSSLPNALDRSSYDTHGIWKTPVLQRIESMLGKNSSFMCCQRHLSGSAFCNLV